MPTRKIAMNVIEEVLRMWHAVGRVGRRVAAARGSGGFGVAAAGGLGRGLAARAAVRHASRPMAGCTGGRRLDFGAMHKELSRRKNLTLQQLWREYREVPPDGYGYSQQCELYRK